MAAPTPHASAHLVPKEAAVAPHPKSPDNVLLALCTRFSDRMREWIRVAADDGDVDADAHQKEDGGDQVRELWELWWSDFGRIRQLQSQTVAGALAKHRIAKSLYEWSCGTDGTWTDFRLLAVRHGLKRAPLVWRASGAHLAAFLGSADTGRFFVPA